MSVYAQYGEVHQGKMDLQGIKLSYLKQPQANAPIVSADQMKAGDGGEATTNNGVTVDGVAKPTAGNDVLITPGAEVTPGANVAAPEPRRPQLLTKKLTVDLLKTYNLINQKYYERKRAMQARNDKKVKKHNDGHDDENYDYIIKAKEKLNNRYTVESIIGKGSFGQVVKAFDEQSNALVAVKIVKSKPAFYTQAQIEIRILQSLRNSDAADDYNIVRMLDTFVHHNHQCIVFELLSVNLYELLRDTSFYGVSLNLIRKFARQLLRTLDFISKHQDGVIHCDLKPENILLRNPRHSAIKVIDFGSACFHNEKMYTYIQSRFYRSPEVILGCSYNCSIDMWSLGCILVEMHTGRPLFNGSHEREQIAQQVDTLGVPPSWMLAQGKKTKKFFSFEGNEWKLAVKLTDKERARLTKRCPDLNKIIGVDTHGPNGTRRKEKWGHTYRDYWRFQDLIRRMLDYDPRNRITPEEALNHKFFQAGSDMSTGTDVSIPLSLPWPLESSISGANHSQNNNNNNSSSSQLQSINSEQTDMDSLLDTNRNTTLANAMLPLSSSSVATSSNNNTSHCSTQALSTNISTRLSSINTPYGSETRDQSSQVP